MTNLDKRYLDSFCTDLITQLWLMQNEIDKDKDKIEADEINEKPIE
jgi:hypothetical protein